jgi:hypothetical protein
VVYFHFKSDNALCLFLIFKYSSTQRYFFLTPTTLTNIFGTEDSNQEDPSFENTMLGTEVGNLLGAHGRKGSFGSLGDLSIPSKRIRSGSISGRLR